MAAVIDIPLFLRVPFEIRYNVYMRLFSKTEAGNVVCCNDKGAIQLHYGKAYTAAILLTCSQIHEEFLRTLSEEGVTYITPLPPHTKLSAIIPPNLVRSIRILSLFNDDLDISDLEKFTHLKHVYIGDYDTSFSLRIEDGSKGEEALSLSFDRPILTPKGKPLKFHGHLDREPGGYRGPEDFDYENPPWARRVARHPCMTDRSYNLCVMIVIRIDFIVPTGRPGQPSLFRTNMSIYVKTKYNIDTKQTTDQRYWFDGKPVTVQRVRELMQQFFEPHPQKSSIPGTLDKSLSQSHLTSRQALPWGLIF